MEIKFGTIGERVIVRSNEPGEPKVGAYIKDEVIHGTKIPVVKDDDGNTWFCGGIVVTYNEELHERLKELSGSRAGWYYLCKILHPNTVDAKVEYEG